MIFSDCTHFIGHVPILITLPSLLRLLENGLLVSFFAYVSCKDWLTLQYSCVADWLGLTSTRHRRVVAARTLGRCSPVSRLVRIRPVP
jgi:hypothetical protein